MLHAKNPSYLFYVAVLSLCTPCIVLQSSRQSANSSPLCHRQSDQWSNLRGSSGGGPSGRRRLRLLFFTDSHRPGTLGPFSYVRRDDSFFFTLSSASVLHVYFSMIMATTFSLLTLYRCDVVNSCVRGSPFVIFHICYASVDTTPKIGSQN